MSLRRSTLTLAAAGGVLVLLAACGGESASDTAGNAVETASAAASEAGSSASSAASEAGSSASSAVSGAADPDQPAADPEQRNAGALAAVDTAAEAAGGTAYAIDDTDGDQNWEVDVWAGGQKVEVKVSADGSNVISQGQPEQDDDGARTDRADTGLKAAIEAALQDTAGTLDEADLDEEGGTVVYTVKIDTDQTQDVELLVGAADGKVTRKG